ncbi:hypothetical protein FOA43_002552 [Brettanomyces nanus]|uniref:Clathrin/coatomer adaptor adaptin-like N-terminal domain-containing protein n=1 Tax=Eeniella nana TaxID=13502 RepID=A0A875S581_EENNA|nr:uncharacterized protein FOA43_002552 [Brettanomyces nanus]QPG75202.1 hypothetical protein FOA43_002552 [Brettanomyces nanus]
MSDSILAKNIGNFFESLNFESSKEYLPPSLTKLINSNYYSKDTYFTPQEIIAGLNSSNDNEIYIVLKFLVCILTTKQTYDEINQVFPHVIKNINSSNLKNRRLVYYILLRFSDQQPDISLLSINAIQKSLTDKNCINRALAIRCLSGINIPAILPILSLSLKKSIKDLSPLVRSASAIAIIKCYTLDRAYNGSSETIGELLKDSSSLVLQLYHFLDILLSDNDTRVIGSAIICFYSIFPSCFDLIHGKLTHLIDKLNYLDPYSTELLLDILTDYSKVFFLPTETIKDESHLPKELASLLVNLKFLMFTDSGSIVLAASRCISTVFPFAIEQLQLVEVLIKFTYPSASCTMSQSHSRAAILGEIDHLLSKKLITISKHQLSCFIPLTDDSYKVCKLKINILFHSIDSDTFDFVFDELKFVVQDSQMPLQLRKYTLQQLNGILATNLSTDQLSKVVRFFLSKLKASNESDNLVSENITGLRQLIQGDVTGYVDVLMKLAGRLLDENTDASEDDNNRVFLAPIAQASIVWLLGEFGINSPRVSEEEMKLDVDPESKTLKIMTLRKYLPDLFRIVVSRFKHLDTLVKLETLHAITKLVTNDIYESRKLNKPYNLQGNTLFKLLNWVLQLTKYDHDVDLRDRSRLVGAIVPNVIYGPNIEAKSEQLNIDEMFENPEVAAYCEEKLNKIELAVYMFQTEKPTPQANAENNQSTEVAPFLRQYLRVTENQLDPAYIEYYNEVRAQGFDLKDYNRFGMNAVSSKSFNASHSGSSSMESPTPKNNHYSPPSSWNIHPNVSKYKLQTLDDFLGENNNQK